MGYAQYGVCNTFEKLRRSHDIGRHYRVTMIVQARHVALESKVFDGLVIRIEGGRFECLMVAPRIGFFGYGIYSIGHVGLGLSDRTRS